MCAEVGPVFGNGQKIHKCGVPLGSEGATDESAEEIDILAAGIERVSRMFWHAYLFLGTAYTVNKCLHPQKTVLIRVIRALE